MKLGAALSMNAPVRLLVTAIVCGCAVANPAACRRQTMSASPPRFLTTGSGFVDYWPCFSPDGKDVLFSRSFDGGRSWELWIVEAEGGKPRRLAGLPVSATRANWSSKNHLIAITGASKAGKSGVWIIEPDGTNPREQMSAGLSDRVFYPSWYPNGNQLAVMDGRDLVIKRIDLGVKPQQIVSVEA